VGRHNAVDKAIGIGALNETGFKECFLTLSGRLTGDMVLKAARVGVPVVASLAAALDSGIAVAEKADLTLVGFVRGKRMNVYAFPKRIVL
jgi:formate dehydrogenase accessory protein FdhD